MMGIERSDIGLIRSALADLSSLIDLDDYDFYAPILHAIERRDTLIANYLLDHYMAASNITLRDIAITAYKLGRWGVVRHILDLPHFDEEVFHMYLSTYHSSLSRRYFRDLKNGKI